MTVDWRRQRTLVIAPHPDDEVIGCGGLISRIKREGGEVHVMYMAVDTIDEYSAAGRSTSQQKLAELDRVAQYLAFDSFTVVDVDKGSTLRLDGVDRARLVDLLERRLAGRPSIPELEPTVVLAPEITSYNQDHEAITRAVLTALRPGQPARRHQPALVLTYEQVADFWSGAAVPAAQRNVFVELTADDVDTKLAALGMYASQSRPHPHTRSEEALSGLAAVRGAQSGYAWAEAFHCLRLRA